MTTQTRVRPAGWARYKLVPVGLCQPPDSTMLSVYLIDTRTAVRFRQLPKRPAGLGTERVRADESWAWSVLLVVLLLAVPYAVGWVAIVGWLVGLVGGR